MVFDATTFLARFWGSILVIMGFAFLLRRRKLMNTIILILDDKRFVFLSGWLAMILGLITILLHNLWVLDWRVVITLFGWVSLMKGVARILFPQLPQKTASKLKKKEWLIIILSIICIVFGAWLIWMTSPSLNFLIALK